MSPKELAQRWFHEVWNLKNAQAIFDLMEPTGVGHTEGGLVTGPEQFVQQMFHPMLAAFPDLTVTIEGCVENGDDAVVRWKASGTNKGTLFGVPATGRKVSFSGMTWMRFTNGKLAEGWDCWNAHGLGALLSSGAESASVCWAE